MKEKCLFLTDTFRFWDNKNLSKNKLDAIDMINKEIRYCLTEEFKHEVFYSICDDFDNQDELHKELYNRLLAEYEKILRDRFSIHKGICEAIKVDFSHFANKGNENLSNFFSNRYYSEFHVYLFLHAKRYKYLRLIELLALYGEKDTFFEEYLEKLFSDASKSLVMFGYDSSACYHANLEKVFNTIYEIYFSRILRMAEKNIDVLLSDCTF